MSISNISLPGISGYDFSSIVSAMVNNYSLPLTQMQKTQTSLETKKNAWRDINTRLSALENTLDKLRQTSTWSATSATTSNSEILGVKSSSGTVKGNYNMTSAIPRARSASRRRSPRCRARSRGETRPSA
jgi:flagellar hook-associated protein 2